MTQESDLERIKAAVQRRGAQTRPEIEAIVAEVRTPDNLGIQPPNLNLALYEEFFLMVEWTFAVPYAQLVPFHAFLRDKEQRLSAACAQFTNGGGRYLGTWWIYGTGPSTYRTLWQYKNEDAIAQMKAALAPGVSPNFRADMKMLRSYWASDPSRVEQQYQPAALFADLKAAASPAGQLDPLVALALEP